MSYNNFTKNLDTYLKELAKAFKKLNGKSMPAELVLVGGAAILTNYDFRNMTADIDAVIHVTSAMKDVIILIYQMVGLMPILCIPDHIHQNLMSF